MIGTLDQGLHDGLTSVPGANIPAYVSSELETDVVPVLRRVEAAHRFLSDTLRIEPRAALLYLSPEDWSPRTSHPLYGMPNYRDGNLIVAGRPNPFWEGLLAIVAEESPAEIAELRRVYGDTSGRVDLGPFFDLLAIHELAHIFIEAGGRAPRWLWLGEFVCNLFLHAYVATAEDERLPILETFPRAFASLGPSRFTHRSLEDFDRAYAYGMDGANYGWYQSRFHVAAKQTFGDTGLRSAIGMWEVLGAGSDGDVVRLLDEHVGTVAGGLVRNWPGDPMR